MPCPESKPAELHRENWRRYAEIALRELVAKHAEGPRPTWIAETAAAIADSIVEQEDAACAPNATTKATSSC